MRKYKKKSNLVNNTGYTNGSRTESNPINYIPSEDITMRDTSYPVDAMPLDEYGYPIGDAVTMYPGEEYKFGGASYVAETPSYKDGGKSDWISNKIGILMKEGRPQKQAIAIAYSMWNQKHEMGGTQLPKYQFAGTAELDQYGQPLPNALPTPTPNYYQNNQVGFAEGFGNPNGQAPKTALGVPPQLANNLKPIDLNAPTAASNKAYADQQAKAPQTISISDSELANPTMGTNIPSKEQKDRMAFNKQVNTAANNYDENGNAIDTSLAAEARKRVENSGTGITQFINPYGDVGMEDALSFSGQQFGKGNTAAGIGGAALGLLKGTKSFLQGMGAQKRQNQVMKDYAEEQRKNMTGEGREQSLKMGGYYQDGGEEDMGYKDDMINKYPNSDRVEAEIAARNPVFGPKEMPEGYVYPEDTAEENKKSTSARDTWVEKTGMPWSEAKKLGYTDGSAKDNTKLLSELNDPRFKKENLRKAPISTPSKPVQRKATPKAKAAPAEKSMTLEDFYKSKGYDMSKKTKNYGEIRQAPEVSWLDKAIEYAGNPLQTFAHYTKYRELPSSGFSRYEHNNLDGALDIINPAGWASHLMNAAKEADVGQWGEAGEEALGAAGALGKVKYVKYIPFNKALPEAREVVKRSGYLGTGVKQLGTGSKKLLLPKRDGGYYQEGGKQKPKSPTWYKEGIYKKAYDESAFQDDIDRNKQPYPKDMDVIETEKPKQKPKPIWPNPTNNTPSFMRSFFQEGGMQPGMEEEQMMMGSAQEEMPQQAGGDQMQAIVQQVAQMLQQGADPQEVLQQLVQAGLPEEQAMQVIQMVMEQMQGAQPQATPQLGQGGQMMKRADGSYSKRGLWDNIRDNAGSGKAPTKQMLEQERKIKANAKEMGGFMYADGGINNPGFKSLPKYVQDKIMSSMYQEGGEMMDEQMEGEDEGTEGETPNMEQIESQVEQALKQGADPQQILEQLVQMGMPEDQAVQMIQEILQEIQGGETEMEGPEQGQPMMKNGGEYLAMMKGKTIKNYTYNKKTGNYDVEFE